MDGRTDMNTTAKARECQFFQWNEGSPSPNLSLTQQDRSHTKEGKRKEGREATGEKSREEKQKKTKNKTLSALQFPRWSQSITKTL